MCGCYVILVIYVLLFIVLFVLCIDLVVCLLVVSLLSLGCRENPSSGDPFFRQPLSRHPPAAKPSPSPTAGPGPRDVVLPSIFAKIRRGGGEELGPKRPPVGAAFRLFQGWRSALPSSGRPPRPRARRARRPARPLAQPTGPHQPGSQASRPSSSARTASCRGPAGEARRARSRHPRLSRLVVRARDARRGPRSSPA